jgi:hypothetical protein
MGQHYLPEIMPITLMETITMKPANKTKPMVLRALLALGLKYV